MNNAATIEKTEKRVARPLKVLVPIIKHDLYERQSVRDEASYGIEIKIGEELLEAKAQLTRYGEWMVWLKQNFHMSYDTAHRWMKAAEKSGRGAKFETLSHAENDTRRGHASTWEKDVRRVRSEMENYVKHRRTRDEEEEATHKLALKIIDIGYKVLSKQLHPDKIGGSHEAMRRLNAAKALLKDAV
jgi:hypothetical protein